MVEGDRHVVALSADAADLPVLARIHAAAFSADQQWNAQALRTVMGMPGTWLGVVMTVVDGAQVPAGFLMARHVVDEAEILTLAVDPAFRRRGMARALLAWLRHVASGHGATRLFLEVGTHNAAAIALYQGAGFFTVGQRRRYYPDGSDALVMACDIAPSTA
ncbi:ribosomal protein S18-alanine N-acetyltransferase [Novacetimonas pomaceti]|uniref:ribosomal protein S18-alanine N-acetyltransferase n=1 Tax=Novacetimonas pomaceti TaxID=2021998 RepID=UPI001C2CDA52|nr:ribosomal protein S18-alanine N-acetyltransferase [Novacetimonas pomaceti]MBV1833383.1 ribosomal protein S18-alanine N-acetyltransferase [Novacetimonas pomaceti]